MRKMRLNGGRMDLKTSCELPEQAFRHTAEYDTAIAAFLAEQSGLEAESCYAMQDGQ